MTFEEEMELLKKNLSAKRADPLSNNGVNIRRAASNHECRKGKPCRTLHKDRDLVWREENK